MLKLLTLLGLGLFSLNAFAFPGEQNLVKCSAKVTSSSDAAYAVVGSDEPLEIDLDHVTAQDSATGTAFDNISVEFGTGSTFIVGGIVGKQSSMDSDSIDVSKDTILDGFSSYKITAHYDYASKTITMTRKPLPFGTTVQFQSAPANNY